jgi:iron complex outermembrane recepter protein
MMPKEDCRVRTSRRWLSGLILFPLASTAYGQGAAAPNGASPLEDATEEIVVTGQRERGAVISDIKPEVRMTAGDVRAMGVSNISELLGEISPQTSGDRGRGGGAPVVLLNGLRISSFAEIRDLPTEAIARVDIFPEELALKYGYRADQKVVNIVLRGRFRAVTTELEPTLATAGGRASAKAEAGLLRISTAGRTSLNAQYQHDTPLYETERDIVAPLPGSGIDQRPFRTLLASGDQFALNGTINRPVKKNISATLNGRFQWDGGTSSLGAILPVGMTIPKPLVRKTDTISGHVGFALNGALAKWQWTLTSNYDINHAVSLTDRGQPQRDRARTTTRDFDTELVANGALFKLPAGGVMASFKAGFESIGLDGRSTRSGIPQTTSLSRNNISGQASFDLPIASRKEAYLSGLGNLSANFNIAVDHLSDFGTLKTFGYGMTWSPVVPLELIASVTDQDGAPSSAQLGNPNLVTPNVQIFDFVRATTVNVSQLSGGNPALIADNRRVIKLGATLKPIRTLDLSITANYTNNRTRNVIASFPTVTPALEAAFPDRFVRAASGQLVSIDSRPVNFAAAERQQLRWGVNVSKRLGPPPKPGSFEALRGQGGDRPPEGAAGARTDGNRGGAGGGGGGRGFGGRQPRLQLALYHTWHLRDSILIRDGLPLLDLLNGAAVGSAGGQSRHEVEALAGFVKNGLGMRMTGTWQSATTVRGVPGSTGLTGGDLHFSDKATLGLRLFADLGLQRALTKDRPWLRGARISVSVDNLFDSKTRVRDAFGVTPFSYQPAYLDPLGRTIRITLRKLFF